MNSEWKFYKGVCHEGTQKDFDDSSWETVTLGHTWNNIDGQDGKPGSKNTRDTDYFRGDGWYRKRLNADEIKSGKKYFLRFAGANMQAEVFVNGEAVGSHKGGYTAFRFDITDYLNLGEENVLAVRVNNERVPEIAPLSADFTFYGGIYREVELIEKNPVHFAVKPLADGEIKISTPSVSDESGECVILATVKNDTDKEKKLTVSTEVQESPEWEKNPFIEKTNFDINENNDVAAPLSRSQTLVLAAGEEREVSFTFEVSNPHLWNGRSDPFLYGATVAVSCGDEILDTASDEFGFRYFSVDKKNGFFLNGKSYPLRGVSRHQDRELLGNALTKKEHDEDFSIIYDLGATAIRLAHYPQARYFYKLCDRYGIVVWAEIPFVDEVGGSGSYENPDDARKEFFEITKQQLRELICQNYNRPSIICWGLQNEVMMQFDDIMKKFMRELHDVAKYEDPYRLTTQATNQPKAEKWQSDLLAWNVYPGWYGDSRKRLGKIMDSHNRIKRPVAISEYGAGGNFLQHCERPKKVRHDGQFHPEEYQTKCHEAFLNAINKRPYLWATFVWNMFDFGSDGRNEGDRPGMNDKGLVSFDRKVKKDSFFLYQSNWSKFPMIHIAESRNTERTHRRAEIHVYSNCENVTLYINGAEIKTIPSDRNRQKGVFVFKAKLQKGENNIRAVGTNNDTEYYVDEIKWELNK